MKQTSDYQKNDEGVGASGAPARVFPPTTSDYREVGRSNRVKRNKLIKGWRKLIAKNVNKANIWGEDAKELIRTMESLVYHLLELQDKHTSLNLHSELDRVREETNGKFIYELKMRLAPDDEFGEVWTMSEKERQELLDMFPVPPLPTPTSKDGKTNQTN